MLYSRFYLTYKLCYKKLIGSLSSNPLYSGCPLDVLVKTTEHGGIVKTRASMDPIPDRPPFDVGNLRSAIAEVAMDLAHQRHAKNASRVTEKAVCGSICLGILAHLPKAHRPFKLLVLPFRSIFRHHPQEWPFTRWQMQPTVGWTFHIV